MKYLWTEDTGAGLHFWKLVNQLFFDNELVKSDEIILDIPPALVLYSLSVPHNEVIVLSIFKHMAGTIVGE